MKRIGGATLIAAAEQTKMHASLVVATLQLALLLVCTISGAAAQQIDAQIYAKIFGPRTRTAVSALLTRPAL